MTILSSDAGYLAARTSAALLDRRTRGRIVLSGIDRASYLQGMLTNDIVALAGRAGVLRLLPHRPGPDDLGPVGVRARRRDAADPARRRRARRCSRSWISSSSARTCSSATSPKRLPALRCSDLKRRGVDRRRGRDGVGRTACPTGRGGQPADDCGRRAGHRAARRRCGRRGVRAARRRDAVRRGVAGRAGRRCGGAVAMPRQRRCGSRAACRGFTATWTRTRFRSKRTSRSRHQSDEGVLRRAGSDHPRPASWPRTRGEEARRSDGVGRRVPAIAGAGAPGGIIRSGDREIGRVTSAVYSPTCRTAIALGYVHRDFVAPGTDVTIDGAPAVVDVRCRSCPPHRPPDRSAISSSSAGGNASPPRAPRETQRISCPCCGRGLPGDAAAQEVQFDPPIVVVVRGRQHLLADARPRRRAPRAVRAPDRRRATRPARTCRRETPSSRRGARLPAAA